VAPAARRWPGRLRPFHPAWPPTRPPLRVRIVLVLRPRRRRSSVINFTLRL